MKVIFIFIIWAVFMPLCATEPVQHDPFALVPIPKCGTHLLIRLVNLMLDKPVMGARVDNNYWVARAELERVARSGGVPKYFCYESFGEDALRDLGYKWIFMYRDPRDAVVSLVFHLNGFSGRQRDFFIVPENWDALTFDEQLYAVIKGIGCHSYLKHWYQPMFQWTGSPECFIVRFEDLLGSNGGGRDELQKQAILSIADHIHFNLTEEHLYRIQDELYLQHRPNSANGIPFIRGQIGNWRLFFTEGHKRAFKRVFGEELIRLGYEESMNW